MRNHSSELLSHFKLKHKYFISDVSIGIILEVSIYLYVAVDNYKISHKIKNCLDFFIIIMKKECFDFFIVI